MESINWHFSYPHARTLKMGELNFTVIGRRLKTPSLISYFKWSRVQKMTGRTTPRDAVPSSSGSSSWILAVHEHILQAFEIPRRKTRRHIPEYSDLQ
jgi:hypothetical protein